MTPLVLVAFHGELPAIHLLTESRSFVFFVLEGCKRSLHFRGSLGHFMDFQKFLLGGESTQMEVATREFQNEA